MYAKYRWVSEKKASTASTLQRLEFADSANRILQQFPEIKVDCIVVKKGNVQAHIRSDPNKLYNYMCKLVFVDHLEGALELEFIPDKRSIKVESGNSLSDYLQTVLWFECKSKARLINNPQESHRNYSLQFVDWISHCVWSYYEDGKCDALSALRPHIRIRPLFF